MRPALVTLVVIASLLVLQAVLAAPAAHGLSPEEARREIRIVAGLAANTTLSIGDVLRIVRSVEECARLELRLDLEYAVDYLKQGDALPGFIYTKILARPELLGDCNASTVYEFLLVMVSHRVGDFFIPSNLELARGIAMRLVSWNASIAEGLVEKVRSVEAWAAVAALGLADSVDPRFWDILAENQEALCLALAVASWDALGSALESRVARVVLVEHPYSVVTSYSRTGWLCEAGFSRLYLRAYPSILEHLVAGSGEPRVEKNIVVDNLALLASGEARLLYMDKRLAKMPIVYAAETGVHTWDWYESLCEDTYLNEYVVGLGLLRDWALLCSRDPMVAGRVESNFSALTLLSWRLWGHRVGVERLNESIVALLESETGYTPVSALEACAYMRRVGDAREAGLVARLAAVREHGGVLLLDHVALRVCGYRFLRALGVDLLPDALYRPPAEPLYAWVLGYLPGLEPPRDSRLLREALLAWRLALDYNLTGLASVLERMAASLARNDTRGVLASSALLARILESSPEVAERVASDAGLARLLSRLASVSEGLVVDLRRAAGLYSALTGVPLEDALAAVSGDLAALAERVASGGLSPAEASRIVETLEVPPSVARRVSRLFEEVARGDERAYVKILEMARRLSGARVAPPPLYAPPLGPPALPLAGTPPFEVVVITAVLVGAAALAVWGARRTGLAERLASVAGLASALRERDPLKRRMAVILAVIAARYRAPRRPWETLREYAARLGEPRLWEAIPVYEEARYARRGRDKALEALKRLAKRLGLPWIGG